MESEDLTRVLATLRDLGADTATIEAKRAKGGLPTKLWETLSAFSNAHGGVLLLGVDEKAGFAISGVDDPGGMESAVANLCSNSMEPPIRPFIQTHQVDGKSIVIIEVPPMGIGQKPCYYRGLGRYGGSFIRVGDNDRKLTDYEINLLIANRGQPRDDEAPVIEATREDLDEERVRRFVVAERRQHPRAFDGKSDERVLRMMKVLVSHQCELVPSLAGLLTLGSFPQQFFPQLNLTFVVYPTSQAGVPGPGFERFLDSASFDGPVSEMVESVLLRLRRNMRMRSVIPGLSRHDVWEYPETALREAIVNALVHRDLSEASLRRPVQIEMYPDRLTMRNPGGLFGTVNILDLLTSHSSSARNPTLLKLLEIAELRDGGSVCEARGSGISAMIESLRADGLGPPIFEDSLASFEVTFRNAPAFRDGDVGRATDGTRNPGFGDHSHARKSSDGHGEVLDFDAKAGDDTLTTRILNLLRDRPLTRQELQDSLGVAAHVVMYRIRELRERRLVERTGTLHSPTAKWQLRRTS